MFPAVGQALGWWHSAPCSAGRDGESPRGTDGRAGTAPAVPGEAPHGPGWQTPTAPVQPTARVNTPRQCWPFVWNGNCLQS